MNTRSQVDKEKLANALELIRQDVAYLHKDLPPARLLRQGSQVELDALGRVVCEMGQCTF